MRWHLFVLVIFFQLALPITGLLEFQNIPYEFIYSQHSQCSTLNATLRSWKQLGLWSHPEVKRGFPTHYYLRFQSPVCQMDIKKPLEAKQN